MEPTREIYWNISWGILVYPVAFVAISSMALGLYARINRWRVGRPDAKPTDISTRLWRTLAYAIGQARILRDPYAGAMHLLIFWGFFVLFIGTLLVMVHEDFHIRILQGNFYLYYKLALNVFGLGAIAGVLMAAFRRYVVKARRLENDLDFAVAIALILVILTTGFLLEGFRIAATELVQHPDWAPWSLGGWGVALLVQGLGQPTLLTLHAITWWFHMIMAFTFIAYCVGWSVQSHILLGPLNVFLGRLGPTGALKPIVDFKDKRALGFGTVQDAAWKDLVDADACVRCGRCQESCPASFTGKPLSPRAIVQKIRRQMEIEAAGLLHSAQTVEAKSASPSPLVGETVAEDEIWSCTTCGACQQQCPIFVEPMAKIVELRRHSVMVQGKLPETAQVALMSLQKRGHPWTGSPHMRADWRQNLEFNATPDQRSDLLYWVGCSGSLVDRNMLVSQAMVRILNAAEVSFSLLGNEESCCGDPARRIGNEYLFQTVAKKNIKVLQEHQVKTILTTCPHCFNTFKNEYPDFGGNFEVIHHTEFIARLLAEGKIKLKSPLTEPWTFHDPCYLARHNDVYQAPRRIAQAIGASRFRELSRSRENSFCCGGGGGRAWMEETAGTRINQARAREVASAGARLVGTACPLCLQMLEDGVKASQASEDIKVKDLAELVDLALR